MGGTIKPTRCAGVVDVRLTTSRSHVVLNVATPTSVSATTTGPLRPRGGRPPVPVAWSILRPSKSSSAMDSVKDHEGFPVLPLTNQHQHKLAGGCMISVEDQDLKRIVISILCKCYMLIEYNGNPP